MLDEDGMPLPRAGDPQTVWQGSIMAVEISDAGQEFSFGLIWFRFQRQGFTIYSYMFRPEWLYTWGNPPASAPVSTTDGHHHIRLIETPHWAYKSIFFQELSINPFPLPSPVNLTDAWNLFQFISFPHCGS